MHIICLRLRLLNGHKLVDLEYCGAEFFKDVEWCSIVKEASKIVLNVKEDEEKSTELAAQLIEFALRRNKFLFGIGARDIP